MEVIDGVKVFKTPSEFFKWSWDYEGDLDISQSGEVFRGRALIAKLDFFKRK